MFWMSVEEKLRVCIKVSIMSRLIYCATTSNIVSRCRFTECFEGDLKNILVSLQYN